MSDLLIRLLLNKAVYPHPVDELSLIETHISWVIIAGEFVYKIKKPVNFGFLDFSTLQKRRHFCEEEIRLNQRFAKELYLDVIPIRQESDTVVLGCSFSEATEFAVKMRKFDQACEFDRLLENNKLTESHLRQLAQELVNFHQHSAVASAVDQFGLPESVQRPVVENFRQLEALVGTAIEEWQFQELETWSLWQHSLLSQYLLQRRQQGHIRECHGDLHLKNITLWQSRPTMFDCIEFNSEFRWIDTISEIAFLIMDLQYRGQYVLAQSFLNNYLEFSGDYQGLRLLKYYLCYRAMVRAKVAGLRLTQELSVQEEPEVRNDLRRHLALASSYTRKGSSGILLMYGLSGSGKSTVARQLAETIQAVVVRSDVERKRLFSTKDEIEKKHMYSEAATQRTYRYLLEQCEYILAGEFPVIVDATFQKKEFRRLFIDYAKRAAVPLFIIHCHAEESVLKMRIMSRTQDVSDADVSVLRHQILTWKGLEDNESDYVIDVDTADEVNFELISERIGLAGFDR